MIHRTEAPGRALRPVWMGLALLLVAGRGLTQPPSVVLELREEPDGLHLVTTAPGMYRIRAGDISFSIPAYLGPAGLTEVVGSSYRLTLSHSAATFAEEWLVRDPTVRRPYEPISVAGFSAPFVSGSWGDAEGFRFQTTGPPPPSPQPQSVGPFWVTPSHELSGIDVMLGGSFGGHGIHPGLTRELAFAHPPVILKTIATASLEVVLESSPPSGADVAFSGVHAGPTVFAGEPAFAGFTLDDADPDDGDGVAPSRLLEGLMGDDYAITASPSPGWVVTGASCHDLDGPRASTLDGNTLTVAIAPREAVTCTFETAELATVTIVQDSVPDGPQDFAFTGDLGAFVLDDDGDPTLDATETFSLAPGTYAAAQTPVTGFDLTAVTCDDTDSAGEIATGTATIVAGPGEVLTCHFENTRRATITIVQDTVPDGPQDFAFTGDLGSFVLDDDGDPTLDVTETFSLAPGTYAVAQTPETGFDLTAVTCDDTDSAGEIATGTATIVAGPGEVLTCRFENTQRATIAIVQDTVPDGPQDFGFTGDLGAFVLDDDGDPTLDATETFSLAPGTYAVAQTPVAGFDLTAVTCDDTDSAGEIATGSATIVAGPGEVLTCRFESTRRATITIALDAQPDDGQAFTFAGDLGPFVLTDVGRGPTDASATFDEVLPGSYAVSLVEPDGWLLDTITCDDGSAGSGTTVVIEAAPAELVTCTFTTLASETDVALEKSAETGGGDGTVLRFTITVVNLGPAPATDLVVVDPLQPGLEHLGNSCGAVVSGSPALGQEVTWSVGTLAVGDSSLCLLEVRDGVAGVIENTASFAMEQIDRDPSNDVASARVMPPVVEIPTLGGSALSVLVCGLALAALGRLRSRTAGRERHQASATSSASVEATGGNRRRFPPGIRC